MAAGPAVISRNAYGACRLGPGFCSELRQSPGGDLPPVGVVCKCRFLLPEV